MSNYEADEEQFRAALEDIRKDHELFDKALSKGWKPNCQKAIETWHTACLELEIGEGYVEHILEEHPEEDIIWRMESVLVTQAEEFLAELGEDVPDKDTDIIAGVEKIISDALEGLPLEKRAEVLSSLKMACQAVLDGTLEL